MRSEHRAQQHARVSAFELAFSVLEGSLRLYERDAGRRELFDLTHDTQQQRTVIFM